MLGKSIHVRVYEIFIHILIYAYMYIYIYISVKDNFLVVAARLHVLIFIPGFI